MKRIGLWFYLLQKRLCRKKSFLVILIAIPLLVLALAGTVKEKSGMIRILLCAKENSGPVATEMINRLVTGTSVILYEKEASIDEACKLLEKKEADAVWIFEDSFEEKLKVFSRTGEKQNLVTIKRGEDSVFLQLAEEQLFGVLFPDLAYEIYDSFIEEKIPWTDMTEEELKADYEATRVKENLVQFVYANYENAAEDVENFSYLTVPVRGLLALFVMLCGLASSMYFMQDEKKKVFTCVRIKNRYAFALGYHGIAVLDGALAMLLALAFSGTFTDGFREIGLLILYGMLVTAFCNLLRMICRKQEYLGMLIPVLLLLMLAVCPIFFNFKQLPVLQYLLPPFYYLNALHDSRMWLYMIVYLCALTAAGYAVERKSKSSV